MKKRKKLFHSILSVMLIIAMVASNFTIAKADTLPEGINKAVKTASLNEDGKTATVQFEIGVDEIKTSEFTGQNTDIVLVLDTSGSMGSKDKLVNMKLAAKKFISSFLEAKDGKPNQYAKYVNIAIVRYDKTATKVSDFSKDATKLNTAIDGLSATGGTNTQAGIHLGQELLNASNADNKLMVLLSDGDPSYSYQGTAYDSAKKLLVAFDYAKLIGNGNDYTFSGYDIKESKTTTDAVTYKRGSGIFSGYAWYTATGERTTYSYSDPKVTVETNATGIHQVSGTKTNVSYKDGKNGLGWYDNAGKRLVKDYEDWRVTISTYSTGLYTSTSEKTIVTVKDHGLPTVSEAALAKGKGTSIYTINYDASSNSNATYVMNNVASPGKSFSASASATAIDEVFTLVGKEIEKVIAAGEGATVTDVIPEYFGSASNFIINGAAIASGNLSEYVVVDELNHTLTWKLGKLEKGTYTFSYDIKLTATADELVNAFGVNEGKVLVPTNKSAVFAFYDKDDKEQKVPFANPSVQVEVYKYTATYNFEAMRDPALTPIVASVSGYAFKGDTAKANVPVSPTGYQAPTATLNTLDTVVAAGSDYTFDGSTTETKNLVVDYKLQEFKVDFVNWDNSELKTETVKYGYDATAPANPSREGYTFTQWNKSYNNITSDTTVTALYNVNKFNVTYNVLVDGVNVFTETQQVEWNQNAIVPTVPNNVKPTDTVEKKYSYSDWNGDGKNIKADTIITAQYTSTPQEYHVTFILKDVELVGGSETLKTEIVQYGKDATAPEVTKKDNTAQYIYTLTDWDKSYTNITGATVVTRTQTRTLNEYTITFEFTDEDGKVTTTEQTVPYGSKVNVPAITTPDNDAQYSYTTNPWPAEAYNEVTKDATYRASVTRTVNTYSYVFKVVEGYPNTGEKVLASGTVEYGTVVYAPEVTTGSALGYTGGLRNAWEEGAEYTITEDTVITAHRIYEINKYNVTFYLDTVVDGVMKSSVKVGDTQSVDHGSTATAPSVDQYTDTAQYIYNLLDWSTSYSNITGNLDVHRILNVTTKTYTVTFEITDEFGITTKMTDTVKYGTAATAPALPTRTDDAEWKYTVTPWDKDYSNVIEDITVKASVTREKQKYTIIFQVSDGGVTSELHKETVNYGTVVLAPPIPGKNATQEFSYRVVNGWETNAKYTVIKDEVYTASYEAVKKEYTINFVVIDPDKGTKVIEKKTVPYGTTVLTPEVVNDKVNTAEWTYSFEDFSQGEYVVEDDMTVYATFTKTKNQYRVTFVSEDGTTEIFKSSAIDYGTILQEVASIPAKGQDAQYSYQADSWRTAANGTGDVVSFTNGTENTFVVKENITVYASYTKVKRSYTVTFKNVNGDPFTTGELKEYSTKVFYGDTISEVASSAAKALADNEALSLKTPQKNYVFAGWKLFNDEEYVDATGALTEAITRDITVYASYKEATNKFTVTFVNHDGAFLSADTVDYGTAATAPSTPSRPSVTVGYITTSYTFKAWDKDFSNITEDITVVAMYTPNVTDNTPSVDPEPTPNPTPNPTPIVTPGPTTEPTPTTIPVPTEVPTPTEVVDIEDDETPEGTVTDEDDTTTDNEEVEINEAGVPQGTAELPKTGTANEVLIYMLGMAFVLLGSVVVKVEKDKKSVNK